MSACRNLITGDVMANVKGDREKFEAGYDAIFGKKSAAVEVTCLLRADGRYETAGEALKRKAKEGNPC